MRPAKEDVPCTEKQVSRKAIDVITAVKELHKLSCDELFNLIKNGEYETIKWTTNSGSSNQIDVELIARNFALHLIAKLIESKPDEEFLRYLLGGIRLLHSLCTLAPQSPKLQKALQCLIDDVKVSEKMLDFIFFTISFLARFTQKHNTSNNLVLLHSALLASSLYLLKITLLSTQFNEVASILLAHPKVDNFMIVAFAAVRVDIQFLQVRLSAQDTTAEVKRLCHYCEASVQFLQSLCQQRLFRERLVKNKELCEEGGILLLAHDIMKLPFCEDSYLTAVVSRLKSKVLSILLNLCEVESVSFLDAAASTPGGLNLAKSTIFQVLELLRSMFNGELDELAAFSDKTYPRGLLQLNAMRLTEILSDDSNFRSYITLNFTEVLEKIFVLPQAEFFSNWCSSECRVSEEDATLDYDSLVAAGWILGVHSTSDIPESTFNASRVPRDSYASQRTSLLVKVVANLTCFIPDLCKEEKDLFLNTFLQCLKKEVLIVERAAIILQNLRSLMVHAETLIPRFLNEDDMQLFRSFIAQLQPLITQESNVDRVKEATGNSNKGISDNLPSEEISQLNLNANEDLAKEEQRPDAPQYFGGWEADIHALADLQALENVQSEEKQMRKRKRNIMNHVQISMIEQALQNEPDMQRKAASIQIWADKLSSHGSEISASQLKNWLNNRKAKLARAAAKDIRAPSGGDNKQGGGSGTDPDPESPDEFFEQQQSTSVKHEQGQDVVVIDARGEEMGKGVVYQASGIWGGNKLDECGLCVVDVSNLKVDKWTNLPHPCDATGNTFAHAEQLLGVIRVLWDSSKLQ